MKKTNILKILSILTLFIPTFALAFFQQVGQMIFEIRIILRDIQYIVFGLAIMFFFWGMGQFILNAGNDKAREEGRQKMIWGVIALFVMFSIYGIIRWIGLEVNINQVNPIIIPIQ